MAYMLWNFMIALTLERQHRDDHVLSVLFILPKDDAVYGSGTKEFTEIQIGLFCLIFIDE